MLEFPFHKVGGHAQQLYEKKTLALVFPSEVCDIFKKNLLYRNLRATVHIKHLLYCNMNIEQSVIVLKIWKSYWKINITYIRHSTGFVILVYCKYISVVSCFFTLNVLCEKEYVSENSIIKFDISE